MAITNELEFLTTASLNTTLGGSITLDGAVMTPSQVDDAFRQQMAYRAAAITRHVAKAAGAYTALKADHNQFWRCTGAVTINLTAAATLTDGWCLWVRANGGAVTIDPNAAELIDGAATLVLADGSHALIICTGTAFFTVNLSALTGTLQVGTGAAQSTALIAARNAGHSIEFGHVNGAGYGSTIGAVSGVGNPYVAFNAEQGTNANTFRTRGFAGAVLMSDLAGGFKFQNVATASADNQTGTDIFAIAANGAITAAGSMIKPQTQVATTSGTSIDFTSIPSWVKRITVTFASVSTNGADGLRLQIGDSGGVENSGYSAGVGVISGTPSITGATDGFPLVSGAANAIRHGALTLTLMNAATNTWACNGITYDSTNSLMGATAGTKPLSATLDRVRLATTGGTNTFDVGSMNVAWE